MRASLGVPAKSVCSGGLAVWRLQERTCSERVRSTGVGAHYVLSWVVRVREWGSACRKRFRLPAAGPASFFLTGFFPPFLVKTAKQKKLRKPSLLSCSRLLPSCSLSLSLSLSAPCSFCSRISSLVAAHHVRFQTLTLPCNLYSLQFLKFGSSHS